MIVKNFISLVIVLGALTSLSVPQSLLYASGKLPDQARENAEKWIDERGMSIGLDPTTHALIFIESASIAVQPSSPLYIEARQAAFESAMQSVRKSAADFLAAKIITGIESKISTKDFFEEILGDPVLADASARVIVANSFIATKEVKDVVRVLANASITGLSPWNTFVSTNAQGGGEIAIVAAMSPKYSSAISTDRIGKDKGQKLQAWIESLSDTVLLSILGTRIKSDENGTLCVLAFGQARIRPEFGMEDFAVDNAKGIADRDLAFIRGQQVASEAFRSALSQQTESSQLPASFRSESEFSSFVKANATLEGAGIAEITRRTVIDPASGQKVVVVVHKLGGNPALAPKDLEPVLMAQRDCPPVPENMVKSTRQVFVKGTGPTLSEAIEKALMEAVRQEGTKVTGNSRLEKRFNEAMESVGNEVKDKVATSTKQESSVQTFSNGFIYSYGKISESKKGEIFEVELCANLVRFDPKNPRFGLPPTIALIPFSCGERAASARGKFVTTAERVIEEALVKSNQYQVIDAQNEVLLQQIRNDAAFMVQAGRAQEVEALKLGNQLTADFVLVGSFVETEFTGLAGPRPQNIEAKDVAMATLEGKIMNVASGEVIWVDTQTVIMKGRDLLLVRANRDVQDPSEPNMSPIELVCARAARALNKSLLEKISPAANHPKALPVGSSESLIRVFGKVLTLNAAFPGVTVGALFAIQNPVEVKLPNGKKVIDYDQFGKIRITSIIDGLAKASLVEGDSDLIQIGVSEIVLLKE